MDKKELFKRILLDTGKRQDLTARALELPTEIRKVIALYGPRRCGKTSLFHQTIQKLLDRKVPLSRLLYIHFEDERIHPFSQEDWERLLESHHELYPESVGHRKYLFLDEVQEIPLWEKFVRRVSDSGEFQVFVTGSSSKLLSREIATSLRGRTLSYFLMPFSFREFLDFKNLKLPIHWEHSDLRHKIKSLFFEYLQFGGFPEILDKEESIKIRILQEYFDLIFYKDIVERHRLRNQALMRELMRYLLSNFASLFSIHGFYHFLKSKGQKISKNTLFEYLDCLEDVSFVKMIPVFDASFKKQQVNPKKAYSIDLGLVTASSFQFSENRGKYLENLVFLELWRRGGKEIYYFKTRNQKEVDFLLVENGKPRQLIQVTRHLDSPKTEQREMDSLVEASKELGIRDCLILTEDTLAEKTSEKIPIKIMPIWSWLLKESDG
jgi:predicted AAA+ superfamily ATPase